MNPIKNQEAKLYVVSAPSGAGKTTLVRALLDKVPNIKFSISYTTRQARPGEVDGEDYYFISPDEFRQKITQGDFLEHAEVFDNYYGTEKHQVKQELESGQNVLLEIDWQGAEQIRNAWPECVSIFILPPSLTELERRLRTRQTDSEAVIQRRLLDSVSDIHHWPDFDYVVINDELESALEDFCQIICGNNQKNLADNSSMQLLIATKGFSVDSDE